MPVDVLTQAAIERIKRVVEDCPLGMNCFPEVAAADVVAVAALVKTPSDTVLSLKSGAEGALKYRATMKVYQSADGLRHLLEQAGV